MTTATTYKPVITLWETYGSGMERIAGVLSQRLGLPLTQQAFSSDQLNQDIMPTDDSMLARILTLIGRAPAPLSNVGDHGGFVQSVKDNDEAAKDNTAFVLKMAEAGGIIQGRSSNYILAGRPNTLHVKLDGPRDARIKRAAAEFGISPDVAERRLRNEDDTRARMSVDIYGYNPLDNDVYDVVINTALMTDDEVVAVIEAAAAAKAARA